MRYLADENFPVSVIRALRAAGHDVVSIAEDSPSIPDYTVLSRSVRENRVLITYDKDYGKLVFDDREPADCGIVLFRFRDSPSESQIRFMVSVLDNEGDWPGRFTVIRTGPTPEPNP